MLLNNPTKSHKMNNHFEKINPCFSEKVGSKGLVAKHSFFSVYVRQIGLFPLRDKT